MTKLKDYVWCDRYECIHANSLDPFWVVDPDELCIPEDHRAVWVEGDLDEQELEG